MILKVAAFAMWDGVTGEPQGWIRAMRRGKPHRRRPGGDATAEYIDE